VARQHVGVSEPEEQQHLHRPRPNPPDHGQPLDDGLRAHPAELIDRRDLSPDGVGGEIADRPGLGLREPRVAQFAAGSGEDCLRIEGRTVSVKRPEPAQDGLGRLSRKLLIDNAVGERLERG